MIYIRIRGIRVGLLVFCFAAGMCVNNKLSCKCIHAIAYKPSRNRFGDQICGYTRVKWLSYKYKLPLLFVPFPYSQELTMFYEEKHANDGLIKFVRGATKKIPYNEPYVKSMIIRRESQLIKALKEARVSTFFICEFITYLDASFNELKRKIIKNGAIKQYVGDHENVDVSNISFASNWQIYFSSLYEPFDAVLKKMLKPVRQIDVKNPHDCVPHDCVTVAVHVRSGSGVDLKNFSQQYYNSKNYFDKNVSIDVKSRFKALPADVRHPSKFPPKQFYIDQIIRVSNILGNTPLFVYLFTDEKDPIELMNEFKKRVNLPNITWGCKTGDAPSDKNMVEDLYTMSQFDCLIRPASLFSVAAGLLGQHKIIISPKHARWVEDDILLIDEIEIDYRDKIINTIKSVNKKKS